MPYWEATREESSLQGHHHRFKAFGAPYFNLFWPSNYDMVLSEEGNPALLLLMIIRDMHGLFLLKSNDEIRKYFINFAKQGQHTYEEEVKAIRTDNG
jgi:hypothetical protein